MKTFQFNINDYWSVILTKSGAATLNKLNQQFKEDYPQFDEPGVFRTNYKAGDAYRQQAWAMIQAFGKSMVMGLEPPFLGCKVVVESSLEEN